MDFEQPRFRIETTAQDLHLIRVIDGEKSWRLRGSGKIEDVPESLFNDEMNWYASQSAACRDHGISSRKASTIRVGSPTQTVPGVLQ
jgi:hypothetical protein